MLVKCISVILPLYLYPMISKISDFRVKQTVGFEISHVTGKIIDIFNEPLVNYNHVFV